MKKGKNKEQTESPDSKRVEKEDKVEQTIEQKEDQSSEEAVMEGEIDLKVVGKEMERVELEGKVVSEEESWSQVSPLKVGRPQSRSAQKNRQKKYRYQFRNSQY